MYNPSYVTIARAIGAPDAADDLLDDGNITVRKKALRLLLQYIALSCDYNEDYYLQNNDDIAEAYEAGQGTDLRKHYREHGFFEGRKAAKVDFDEDWYLKTYADVAASVAEGDFSSGLAHFLARGEIEMRSPNERADAWVQAWAESFSHQDTETV
ncbi:hypothetical protein [Rhodoblastus sp.]|jgi:hypothetical protein|uniref:hypothetical protein n=1 Tax=Rhodoblastus sp. TaxID=1962975 RepID=UPI0025EE38A1|nr:hypothetical protein [Rhodoblastus sp.]